eukprot:1157276-Pelagomonas_calceolata.AAC.6
MVAMFAMEEKIIGRAKPQGHLQDRIGIMKAQRKIPGWGSEGTESLAMITMVIIRDRCVGL